MACLFFYACAISRVAHAIAELGVFGSVEEGNRSIDMSIGFVYPVNSLVRVRDRMTVAGL